MAIEANKGVAKGSLGEYTHGQMVSPQWVLRARCDWRAACIQAASLIDLSIEHRDCQAPLRRLPGQQRGLFWV